MSGIIESLSGPGEDFRRSEGRAYNNVEQTISDPSKLVAEYYKFSIRGTELHHRRRVVYRARCSQEVVDYLLSGANTQLPIEVILPLSLIDPTSTDALVTLGENVHPSQVPEWKDVYHYWQRPNGNGRTPIQRIEQLPDRFALVHELHDTDVSHLSEIWQPFGWTRDAVAALVHSYQADGKLFSGIFDRQEQCLVSGCIAEGMSMAGVRLFEGTEYGTLPAYSGHGLCTAAVIGLHAQILDRHYYASEEKQLPLILSEFNMSSRSDIVGRHAGMTIPYIEGSHGYDQTPFQVLRHNVSVKDGLPRNELSWRAWEHEQRNEYREAFQTPYRFWRNFIVGLLPAEAISQHYSREYVQYIVNHMEERN